jgi:hypothetical protein
MKGNVLRILFQNYDQFVPYIVYHNRCNLIGKSHFFKFVFIIGLLCSFDITFNRIFSFVCNT